MDVIEVVNCSSDGAGVKAVVVVAYLHLWRGSSHVRR